MHWFDWEGLILDLLLLAPNFVFACRHRDGFVNLYHNKAVECLEQIGRFGCFLFLFLTPPVICRGVWFSHGTAVCRIVSGVLIVLYLLGWLVFRKESSVRKSVALSVIPSALFLMRGVLTASIPLMALGAVFAVCHVTLSVQNALLSQKAGQP